MNLMPFRWLVALAAMAVAALAADAPFHPTIERFDPAFDHLVARDAQIEKIADGIRWAEGPVWYQHALIFSDPPANIARRWAPNGKVAVFLQPSGGRGPTTGLREPGSNGLGVDRKGRLLLCQDGARRIARYEAGKFTDVASRYEGRRFNSPNDLTVRHDGTIYFTDPPYGLDGLNKSPLKEMPWNGVYRVSPDGKVGLLIKDLTFPNGIALSPDEKTLYVNNSDGDATRIMAYDVAPDGSISNGRTFLDRTSAPQLKDAPGVFDGLKVDREGNLWTSGPGGILIVTPQGKVLGRLHTGVPTANCAWGDDDGSTLYITANHYVLRLRTLTSGPRS